MAFQSADGSKFTNRSTMQQHEARVGSKAPQPADVDDHDADNEPQDGAAIAAEHGPAIEVDVHHDHEANKHSVHASHPDGHEHQTEHATADEAHKFAAAVSGVGQAPEAGY